ncbi:MAG TPA: hypothetical protein VFY93_03865 [Planctomycetota bacterium]|nr:hypothetical protein [Planctomycetota bacterium]
MLQPPSVPRLLYRVLRISCPACGRGRIFRRFFLRAERCAGCGRPFEREEGYWVGGSEVHMFASFGLSVILCVPFLVLFPPTPLLYAGVLLGHVAVSVAIFRYSRALFLAVDFYLDPGAPAVNGDDPGGLGLPERPRPAPGHARRAPGGRRASRRERQPADAR